MKTIVEKFAQYLTEIKYPTKKEHWNIGGVLKHSNADKMVFETENAWVILDVPEISQYVRKHKIKILYLEKLIEDLEWNISINK